MIIKYQKKYLKEFAKLDLESGLPYYKISKPTHQDLIEWLNDETKKKKYYLNKKNGEIVGALGFRREFLDIRKACELYYLAVRRDQQGKGIGKELMTWFENKMKEEGFKKIFLTTEKVNTKARDFYEKIGYKEVGFLKEKHKNSDAIIYRKDFA